MSQHDYDLANQSGASFRADANAALAAIVSQNSGATAPATTFPYMLWVDTSTGILKQRNGANSGWITVGRVADTGWGLGVDSYSVVGCRCANNASTPDTQFDLDADAIVLRDVSNQGIVRHNPALITNNIATAGPTANGRDQAAAFSNNSWVHFYWIDDGATLASVSSAAAPPIGPVLPSGFTNWCYATSVRKDGAGALKRVRSNGAKCFLDTPDSVLNSGAATSETAIDLSAAIPPNALSALIGIDSSFNTDATGAVSMTARLRVASGLNFYSLVIGALNGLTASSSTRLMSGPMIEVPNVGQALYYLWNISLGSNQALNLSVHGYTVR